MAGMGGDGAGDGHALLLAAGHLGGLVPGALGQTHPLQGGLHPVGPLGGGHALVDEGQLHILPGVEGGDEVEALEDEADLLVADVGELPVRQLGDVHAVQVVVPVGGDIQAAQDIHEGGLAGAGLADDGQEFSPVHGEGDAVQCANLALLPLVVDFKEVFYINEHTGALFNSTFRRGSGSR